MSKRADAIRASAASLADLEEEFGTPAAKQYPPVVKEPANTQPSAAAKPPVVTPAPGAEVPNVEAQPIQVPTPAAPQPPPSAEVAAPVEAPAARRRGGKGAAKTGAQKLPPSRVGKVPINVWTTEEKRRALKIHAASEGTTVDELMTEALDDILKKRRIRVG